MNITLRIPATCLLVLLSAMPLPAADSPAYTNDFESATLNDTPEGLLVLDGTFTVRQDQNNKFLELPGAPLEGFGFLFGPTAKDGLAVSARIYGTQRGRRYPTFAIGLNGVGGYRLQVAPAKQRLELLKGDTVAAFTPYQWKPGTWHRLRLQIRPGHAGNWLVEGKVWNDTAPEPAQWSITHADPKEPIAGRPSAWGQPFSGTPIRFDDLLVTQASR